MWQCRKIDVGPTDANTVKQISTALTCVTATILELFVSRTAVVQIMIILKKTRMLRMKLLKAVDRTVVFSLEQRLSSDLSDLVMVILRLLMLEWCHFRSKGL